MKEEDRVYPFDAGFGWSGGCCKLKDCKAFCVKMGGDDSEWEERDAKRKTMGEYF